MQNKVKSVVNHQPWGPVLQFLNVASTVGQTLQIRDSNEFSPMKRVFYIPATSAFVERVFSYSGLPHRADSRTEPYVIQYL